MKFTKGELKVVWRNSTYVSIESVKTMRPVAVLNAYYNGKEEVMSFEDLKDYSALFAAAPELLKELQKIKLDMDLGTIRVRKDSPIYEGVERVINKALKQ